MHHPIHATIAVVVAVLIPALPKPASAQSFTLPEIGMEKDGACQQIAVRERNGKAMVPLGCVSSKGWVLTPDTFRSSGIGTLDTTFQTTINPNAVQISPGMGVAYCPGLACIPGITDQNQRASVVISGKSQLDGEAEEQLLALSMTTKTGRLTDWKPRTPYEAGTNVYNKDGDNVFRVASKCISGPTMPVLPDQNNPKGAVVTNGSCQLKWINRGAIAAKLTAYFENEVEPGAGNAWTQANNFIMRPGAPTNFNINTEMDFSNLSGADCPLGHYCTALRLGMGGPNKATQALDITTDNTERFKTIWGIRLNGLNLASDALIGLDSSTKYGILSNLIGLANPTFSEAMIGDASVSSKTTLQATGSRTQSVIDTQGVTIAPQGGSPTAVVMAAGQQVCFAGFNVCWRYDTTAKRMKLRWNGQDVASIDSGGNARFLGAVTGNTTP
ncbi:hypothetical protein PUR23_16090 [Methylorubrum populi]|uniref:hypothetical protein n=1 Tax=Methylorubrum populi TaxID=223967 RepID=UPI0031F96A7A